LRKEVEEIRIFRIHAIHRSENPRALSISRRKSQVIRVPPLEPLALLAGNPKSCSVSGLVGATSFAFAVGGTVGAAAGGVGRLPCRPSVVEMETKFSFLRIVDSSRGLISMISCCRLFLSPASAIAFLRAFGGNFLGVLGFDFLWRCYQAKVEWSLLRFM
jgi:hypothetical protein